MNTCFHQIHACPVNFLVKVVNLVPMATMAQSKQDLERVSEKNPWEEMKARNPSGTTLPLSARGLPRRLKQIIKKHYSNEALDHQSCFGCDIETQTTSRAASPTKKFEPRTWKTYSDKELAKMNPVQRSRYLAYKPPAKEIQEKKRETAKRVSRVVQLEKKEKAAVSMEEFIATQWNNELSGHLKASDARLRLQRNKLAYDKDMEAHTTHLITSQPSSLEAVRLKSFLQPSPLPNSTGLMEEFERERSTLLVEDDKGLLVQRSL